MKRRFIKGANCVLAGLLSLLGFSGCSDDDIDQGCAPMYGVLYTKYADYIVSGKVMDVKEKALPDIRVVVPRVIYSLQPNGSDPFEHLIQDTLYTGEDGDFEFNYKGAYSDDTLSVNLKFEDTSNTSLFDTDSLKVMFVPSDLKGAKGDYKGKAEKKIHIKLKNTEDEKN